MNEMKYGMKINTKKVKVMKISRVEGEERSIKITIDEKEIEKVTKFCYLGNLISDDAKCHKESKKRIAMMGKKCLLKEIMKGGLNRDIKKRMVKALVWSRNMDDEK